MNVEYPKIRGSQPFWCGLSPLSKTFKWFSTIFAKIELDNLFLSLFLKNGFEKPRLLISGLFRAETRMKEWGGNKPPIF